MIERVETTHLRVPLETPYRLSHTTVERFDVILVRVEEGSGNAGIGEVTTLEGYSSEDATTAWTGVTDVAAELPGRSTDGGLELARSELDDRPFSRSALATALETVGASREALTAPIGGILSAEDDREACEASLSRQVEAGYRTIKLKIGFDPVRDAERLTRLTELAPDDVTFRVDANRSYSMEDARTFVTEADTSNLQLLEQPLPTGRLEDHATLRREFDVDLMLDEEIRGLDTIERAAERNAADMIKLKLMKQGGIAETKRAIDTARSHGLDLVLGNGVQSDVGCVHEARVWHDTGMTTVGEFNGWLKQVDSPIQSGPSFDEGTLTWDGKELRIDESVNRQYGVESALFCQ